MSREVPPVAMEQRLRVGRRIRELREAREWTQYALAERAGISRWSVYRAELATHSPSLDHLALIAAALGVPLTHLVREQPPSADPGDA